MNTITPHIVVSDASAAAAWYKQVLGAEERSRIEVPGGKLMQVELWFGDSAVMLADEFPELGVLSPLSIGGTATVLHLDTNDVDEIWSRAVDAGAEVRQPLHNAFWGERYGQITDPFGRSKKPPRQCSTSSVSAQKRDVPAPTGSLCVLDFHASSVVGTSR
jgi:PhnB protein